MEDHMAEDKTFDGIKALIEKNFSVEQVGMFKPDPRVYQIAVDGLNVKPEEIVFQSSQTY